MTEKVVNSRSKEIKGSAKWTHMTVGNCIKIYQIICDLMTMVPKLPKPLPDWMSPGCIVSEGIQDYAESILNDEAFWASLPPQLVNKEIKDKEILTVGVKISDELYVANITRYPTVNTRSLRNKLKRTLDECR